MSDYTYITTHQGEEIFFKTCADKLRVPDSELGSWTLTLNSGDLATISISELNTNCTITSFYEPRPRRLRCEYCGCISSKEFGTCEHCGAPLTIEIV